MGLIRGTTRHLPLAFAVVLLTALSYRVFPGHTYLQQDNQIYAAILEHLYDPSVLAADPVATRHHVTFTIYDELALAVRRLTGWEFQPLLVADQLLHRALGILGVYLMATALGLSRALSLLVAAAYTLGATVGGPAVLTVEYEPKPRSSALPMTLLAVGLIAHRRYVAGGFAASLAFLYHPPTVYPFWLVYFVVELWPSRPEEMKRRIEGILPLAGALVVLMIAARLQPGLPEPDPFFGTVDAELEQLQKWRAPYAWVSLWIGERLGHFLILWGIALAAFLRLRPVMPLTLRFFAVGLPLVGLLSLPVSYLLLDRWKWALATKAQPARALLFVTLMAVILPMAAGLRAGAARRFGEAFAWCTLAFLPPLTSNVVAWLGPGLADPTALRRLALAGALAALAAGAALLAERRHRLSRFVWATALVAPFFLIPSVGRIVNYPQIETPELDELIAWARANTPKEAVFAFPGAGRSLQPGVFRAKALRAVYVDWKGGGQINMVKGFAEEWRKRWQEVMEAPFEEARLADWATRGIDYIVVAPSRRLAARPAEFENAAFVVYCLRKPSG